MSTGDLPIILSDVRDLNIARFKTGYDMDFQKLDSDWYIQRKPKIPDDPETLQKQAMRKKKNHLYKPPPVPGENVWFLNSASGRYFKESIEEEDSDYFLLLDKGDHFEAFVLSEQHTFNPISKPHLVHSEEERKAFVCFPFYNLTFHLFLFFFKENERKRAAELRRKEMEKISQRASVLISNIAPEKQIIYDKEDTKAESMDYEHDASDDEGIEISKDIETEEEQNKVNFNSTFHV